MCIYFIYIICVLIYKLDLYYFVSMCMLLLFHVYYIILLCIVFVPFLFHELRDAYYNLGENVRASH